VDLRIAVAADKEIADARIAAATRELLKDIRADTDPRASLVTSESPDGSKGDLVGLGQIALALVTGGPVSKFIECLFGFLGRNRKLGIEVQNATGEKLKLDMDFVDREGSEKAMALIESFLKRGS
jgi:hypothetical protein